VSSVCKIEIKLRGVTPKGVLTSSAEAEATVITVRTTLSFSYFSKTLNNARYYSFYEARKEGQNLKTSSFTIYNLSLVKNFVPLRRKF
jgi:hypothetical protein